MKSQRDKKATNVWNSASLMVHSEHVARQPEKLPISSPAMVY